jgi:hypothetical protein
MTKDIVKLTTLTAAIVSVPLLAFAELSVGDQVGTDEAAIRAWFEAQGAEVIEIELEDSAIEVEYLLDGAEYEAELDAATGEVAALEAEGADDDEEEDDDHADMDGADDDGADDSDDEEGDDA